MNKRLIGIIASMAVISLTGCSSMGQNTSMSTSFRLPIQDPHTYGYKKGDPCFRCGESWIFIHRQHEPKAF